MDLAETITERCELSPKETEDLLLKLEGADGPYVALLEAITKEDGWSVTPLLHYVATLGPDVGLDDLSYYTGPPTKMISVTAWIGSACPYVLPLAIKAGAKINQVLGWPNLTPLGCAVSHGFVDLAKQLLEMGADPNLAGGAPCPLYYALIYRDRVMLELLLEAGANPNDRLNERYPHPLLVALRVDVDFARLLLLHGADWRMCPSAEVASLPFDEFRWFVECSGYTHRAIRDEGESLVEQLTPEDPKMALALSV